MGRLLGSHADEQELDRPDLNKCPDCGCFFPQDNCPLCGKPCPDNMKAGNRPAVKQQKRKRGGNSGRVVFINWYHSLWFIVLMMFIFPVIGLILLYTSPHSKNVKISLFVIGVIILILSTVGIGKIVGFVSNIFSHPVDTSLTREEYVSKCDVVLPEDYYRSAADYKDAYVSLELKVKAKLTDNEADYNGEKYTTYYLCSPSDNDSVNILVRNCLIDSHMNFIPGDVIKVYGEGADEASLYDSFTFEYFEHPCINMAYFESVE